MAENEKTWTFGEVKTACGHLPSNYQIRDISDELFREYVHPKHTYRIENPVALITREGGSTHRVVDFTGTAHCVPFGQPDCPTVLRWFNKTGCPVLF